MSVFCRSRCTRRFQSSRDWSTLEIRKAQQRALFMAEGALSEAHSLLFYLMLNELLAKAGLERYVESRCRPYYADTAEASRPGRLRRLLNVHVLTGIRSNPDFGTSTINSGKRPKPLSPDFSRAVGYKAVSRGIIGLL